MRYILNKEISKYVIVSFTNCHFIDLNWSLVYNWHTLQMRMYSNSRRNVYLLVVAMWLSTHIPNFSSASKNSKTNIVKPQYLEQLLKAKQFKRFARILDIPNTNLVDPSQRKSSDVELIFYNGMPFTDILMRPGQVLDHGHHHDINEIVNLTISKWQNGIVPYYITNTYFNNETRIIKNKIAENNRLLGPNIKLRPYQDGDSDYVLLFNGGCGCYSNLGNVGGPQVISLLSICLDGDLFSHELHHTLGFSHECNRIDRDAYFRLIPENIPEAIVLQYKKYSAEAFVNVGPFDYYSIVGFGDTVPGFDLKAFDFLQDGIETSIVGKDTVLSPTDIQRVKTVYSQNV